MELTLKYFKYLDPETQALTKSVGYVYKRTLRDKVVKVVNGVKTVIKDDEIEKVVEEIPPVESFDEITKEEFEALDVKNEPKALGKHREKKLAQIQKLATKISNRNTAPSRLESRKLKRVERLIKK